MPDRNEPAEIWWPRRSFANTDPRAVKLAELLHKTRQPQLTILFGSRARGDHAEGRSNIAIMLVESHPPEDKVAADADMAFRKAKAELYRGQHIGFDLVVRTPEDFRKRCPGVNELEAQALRDGHIIGQEAEYYRAFARRIGTRHQTRWANQHLEFMQNTQNESQGVQAYLAVRHALMAAVNAAGEWCPDIHDVEMLLELARQADPEGRYATTLDPEIYTQYGDNREGIPLHTSFTSRPEHLEWATQDVQAILARTETLKDSWPPPENTPNRETQDLHPSERETSSP